RYENPFCDRPIQISPKEFAMRWGIPESSVYEAVSKLKDKGIIKTRLGKVTIQWVPHSQQEADSDNPENIPRSQNQFRESRMNSDNPENIPKSQNEFRNPRMDSEIPEKRPPKRPSVAGSSPPQTLQTDQTPHTIQMGVGVENSGSGSDLDLVNKEICASEQSYLQQEEVQEEKLVDKKDPGEDQSSADVAQVTTKRVTKSTDSTESPVISKQLPVTSHQSPVSSEQLAVTNEQSPVTQCSDIPEDLISKLKDLGISLDGEVKRTIADHDISQAYGAVRHVENTWETINNPRGVFLHQIPLQRVQKGPKPISENFLEWYQWAIADGLVIDRPVKSLMTNSRGEPKVNLTIDPAWAEDWQKVRDNPDDYRQKLDPTTKKELWAKMRGMFNRPPKAEPEPTLNDQLQDPILADELYPQIKHSHDVEFTREGLTFQATPIVDIEYDENGVPVEEVKS
ncbi:hypothetical protein, partial [Crocosphaera sp.]|uniref:hypothetical protein n=1 Tax=Crocosphaera sp. TaxID=2729996 RepID=UPI00257DB175